MISRMQKVPATRDSYPFISAEFHCGLSALDYIEDEYFMTGTANIYDEADGGIRVVKADAPYTTRLLVRRPRELSKFSGNVIIEVLNASAMMDIDRMWVNLWKTIVRNGDIYIGITSKGHVVQALKDFNAERYTVINWSDPRPDEPVPEALCSDESPFRFLPGYESGLYWDMQNDLAVLLRQNVPLNPIAEYGKRWLYLAGWSQSGGYLTRTVNTFVPRHQGAEPLFDGYYAAGCGNANAPLNARSPQPGFFGNAGVPSGKMIGASVPYVCVNTESENRAANWIGDFDQPGYKFRTYQIAGSSHDTEYNLLEYYAGRGGEDCTRIGHPLTYDGVDGEPMDMPYEFIFGAVWRNLTAWVRIRVPAPHAPKIETEVTDAAQADPFGIYIRNMTDITGNTKGGLRLPMLDAPLGVYHSCSHQADGSVLPMFGRVVPYSPEKLRQLYGSAEEYRALMEQLADRLIAKGFLLAEDRGACVEKGAAMAKRRGLT